ncbi:MAG: TetR/AcrR family transcriptional regulator [Solirubrobacteraceae bacterium]
MVPEEAEPLSRRAESSEATRAALIEAARELFAHHGYNAVSTQEIVRRARVSRGALYHHFRDKRDLFRAVFEQVDQELVQQLAQAGLGIEDPWAQLNAGWKAFLDACVKQQAVQRIGFVEAPAVLGWAQWRQLDSAYALGLVRTVLENAMQSGMIQQHPVAPLAHVILGALNEAGMLIANAKDPEATRGEVADALTYLFDGLRSRQN